MWRVSICSSLLNFYHGSRPRPSCCSCLASSAVKHPRRKTCGVHPTLRDVVIGPNGGTCRRCWRKKCSNMVDPAERWKMCAQCRVDLAEAQAKGRMKKRKWRRLSEGAEDADGEGEEAEVSASAPVGYTRRRRATLVAPQTDAPASFRLGPPDGYKPIPDTVRVLCSHPQAQN
jgi:hypothetical protein